MAEAGLLTTRATWTARIKFSAVLQWYVYLSRQELREMKERLVVTDQVGSMWADDVNILIMGVVDCGIT